jgi:hypothetical protein
VRAIHPVVIVFIKAKDLLKFLAAIVAKVVVHGHGEPPGLERVVGYMRTTPKL